MSWWQTTLCLTIQKKTMCHHHPHKNLQKLGPRMNFRAALPFPGDSCKAIAEDTFEHTNPKPFQQSVAMKSMKSFSGQEPESEAVGQLVRAELQQSGVILTSLPACSQQSCRGKPSLILLVKEMHAVSWSFRVSQTGLSWNHLLAVAKLAPASDTSVCQPHGS